MSIAFSSEWLDWKKENIPTQRTDKTDKRASVSNVSSLPRAFEDEKTEAWKLFYPDLDPDEWEITHTEDGGICGKKVEGEWKGPIGFYLPAERLKEGPPAKRRSRVEEWDFEKVRIGKDVWMFGRGVHDSEAWICWSLRSSTAEEDTRGEAPNNITALVPKQKGFW